MTLTQIVHQNVDTSICLFHLKMLKSENQPSDHFFHFLELTVSSSSHWILSSYWLCQGLMSRNPPTPVSRYCLDQVGSGLNGDGGMIGSLIGSFGPVATLGLLPLDPCPGVTIGADEA